MGEVIEFFDLKHFVKCVLNCKRKFFFEIYPILKFTLRLLFFLKLAHKHPKACSGSLYEDHLSTGLTIALALYYRGICLRTPGLVLWNLKA